MACSSFGGEHRRVRAIFLTWRAVGGRIESVKARLFPFALCCALPLAAQMPDSTPADAPQTPEATAEAPAAAPQETAAAESATLPELGTPQTVDVVGQKDGNPVVDVPADMPKKPVMPQEKAETPADPAPAAAPAPAAPAAQPRIDVSVTEDGTPVIKLPAGLPAPLRNMVMQRIMQQLSAQAAAAGTPLKEPVVETVGDDTAPQPPVEPAAAPEPAPAAPQESAQPAAAADLSAEYKGIVKIEVAVHLPDFQKPWQSGKFGMGNGTGFMVSPGVFLTNAHVVANAERIHISPFADSRKIPATVRHVAHDADLALVEIEDKSAFADVPCLQLSNELPQLEESVRAIGYPIGGKRLSVTRGIVSRIDTISYSHPRNASHLALQIDAAINPGNSGGPVLKGDKVVGVAFQGLLQANSTGYVIPAPVIAHFLKDVEDGHYDGYVDLGVDFMDAENPALRRRYNLPDNARGCLVADVVKGSSSDGQLQPGDIVLAVNGHPVDSSAMIELDGVRVNLQELAERSFNGDTMTFTLLRDGKETSAEVALKPLPASDIMALSYDKQPRYIHFGGLVFQPLNIDVINAHKLAMRNFIVPLDDYMHGGEFREKEDIVALTQVLPDEINARSNPAAGVVVTKVNGTEVKGLSHLYSLLYPAEGQERPAYTVIELAGQNRPLVFDNAAIDAANTRIMNHYNIPESARLNP